MLNNPDWSAIFAPSGALLKEGETIYRTNLSNTLAVIANEGPEAFYKVFSFLPRRLHSHSQIGTNCRLDCP
jgi:gamma-glutamyltranspeptidase / glutathione hydrolase / leukotriene-C4 hydrolase